MNIVFENQDMSDWSQVTHHFDDSVRNSKCTCKCANECQFLVVLYPWIDPLDIKMQGDETVFPVAI